MLVFLTLFFPTHAALTTMVSLAVALAVAILTLIFLRSKYKRGSSHLIPGPESPSFLVGNMLQVASTFTGVYSATLRWRRQFGDAPLLRIKGPLFFVCSHNYIDSADGCYWSNFHQGDSYLVSDPAALRKIYDPRAGFIRPPSMIVFGEKIFGVGGIVLAEGKYSGFVSYMMSWWIFEGESHVRIKRIMQPAFNASHVKKLFPKFRIGAQAVGIPFANWASFVESHPCSS